jgi:uncharacterized alkaline shock family protein YloU
MAHTGLLSVHVRSRRSYAVEVAIPTPTIEAVEGHSVISAEILGDYAADAAREVPGVRGLVDGMRPRHRGVRVTEDDNVLAVELHLAVDWGAAVPDLGSAVQRRVADYLGRMSGVEVSSVDVVVDEVGAPVPPG